MTDLSSTGRPSVLVVGGGYGGINAAKALDDVADVTLVDPTEAFVHNVAAWRTLVEPEWLDRIFLPYAHLLANGRFVRDRAVAVDGTPRHARLRRRARARLPRARHRLLVSVPGQDRGARHRLRPIPRSARLMTRCSPPTAR